VRAVEQRGLPEVEQRDVVVFQCIFLAWIPRCCRKKEENRVEVTGAVSGESDGLRADGAVPLQSEEEGAQMDILESIEPRKEVLRLR
jgi:hypothetical protein